MGTEPILEPGRDHPGGVSSGDLGELYWSALEYSEAEEEFTGQLGAARGAERTVLLRKIGQCRERRGDHGAALAALHDAEDAARSTDDPVEKGRIAYLIGKILFHTGEFDRARQSALEARDLLRDSDDVGERGAVENLLGGIAYRRGDLDRARRHFDEALFLGKDGQNLTLLSRAYNNVGLIHKALCDWDQAIDCFHASLGFDSTASNYDSRFIAWMNLGIVHAKRSEWREAESMFRRAHKTCVEVGNPLGQAMSLLGLASVERARHAYNEAEARLGDAVVIAKRHEYRRELVLAEAMRAWIALDQNDLDTSRHHLTLARRGVGKAAPAGDLACHLQRLEATIDLAAGDLESAGKHARGCRELAQRSNDRYEQATIARIEGMVLAETGQWTAASECFESGVRALRRMGERHQLGLTLGDWGASAARHGAGDEARIALDRLTEAVRLLDEVGDRGALVPAHHAQATLHHRMGRADNALEALARAWEDLDSCSQQAMMKSALSALQREIETQVLSTTAAESNRVLAVVGLLESLDEQPNGKAPAAVRFVDQVSELVAADGALLVSESRLPTGGLKAEAVSGLRTPERRAILEVIEKQREALASAAGRVLFASEPCGSALEIAVRLGAVRPIASLALLPIVGDDDRLWVLYLDRDRRGSEARNFSPADLEILSALASRGPELVKHVGRQTGMSTTQRPEPTDGLELGDFVSADPPLRDILENVERIRGSSIRVLLQGETGTGKGMLARIIHRNSARRDRPFRVLNCANLPETLLQSELFGHVKGAFTGASSSKIGLLEEADGGTIFLDDIEKAGASVQRGLLHFLDCGEIRPVGSTERRHLDVRVICATSSPDLEESVRKGAFSKDLYYRLHHFTITVPPLRERKESILPLAQRFVESCADHEATTAPREIAPETAALLEQHDWPGNVRELENTMRRAVVLARSADSIGPELLPPRVRERSVATGPGVTPASLAAQVETLEASQVREALKLFHGNKSHAAEHLGLTRKGLRNKMRRYGVADL